MFDPRREKLSPRQEVLIPTAIAIVIGMPAVIAAALAGWSDDALSGILIAVVALVTLGWIFLVLAPQSRSDQSSNPHR